MSRLLRFVACAAAPLLAMATAADEEYFQVSVPHPRAIARQAAAQAGVIDLMQSEINITDSVVVVNIPLNLFSANCGTLLASLNVDQAADPLNTAALLRAQYIDLVVNVFQQCVIDGLLAPDEIEQNNGDLVVINASPCTEVSTLLNNFENSCAAAIASAATPPSVCDLTFCQNFFFEEGQNSIESYICYDVYWCFPNTCSADEVEILGAYIMSELQELDQSSPTGSSEFGAWSTCTDAAGFVRDFNGGEDSFITALTISGTGSAQQSAASSIIFSVESSLSPDLLVSDVVCKITDGVPGEDWAKACCGQLNMNENFQALRMYCDVSERSGTPFNMTIYSPFEDISLNCQADTNAQDNQPGNQPVQLCTSFDGANTVGISLSGETFPFNAEPMITQNIPTTQPEEIIRIDEQTLPPQQQTGNGPAPPLIEIINGPLADNAENGAGSTRPPALFATIVCAAAALFSRL